MDPLGTINKYPVAGARVSACTFCSRLRGSIQVDQGDHAKDVSARRASCQTPRAELGSLSVIAKAMANSGSPRNTKLRRKTYCKQPNHGTGYGAFLNYKSAYTMCKLEACSITSWTTARLQAEPSNAANQQQVHTLRHPWHCVKHNISFA